jgi:cyanate permease
VFYGWIITGAVFLVYFSNVGLTLYAGPVINAGMAAAEAPVINETVVGTAVAICTACHGILSMLSGALVRKTGVKRLMIFGSLLLCAGFAALSLIPVNAPLYIILYGFALGPGLAFGGILMSQSLLNDWFSRNKGLALSLAVSAGSVCGIIAPPLVSGLISYGWRNGWALLAGMAACSALVSAALIVNRPGDKGLYADGAAEAPPAPKVFQGSVGDIFKHKTIYCVMSANLSQLMVYYALTGHLMIFLTRDSGIEPARAALCFSIISLVTLISRLAGGALGGRLLRPETLMSGANFADALGLAVLCFSQALPAVYAAAFFLGAGSGLSNIAYPLVLSARFGAERFPRIAGFTYPINYTAAALGPLLAGIFAGILRSYIPAFMALAALCALGGCLLFLVRENNGNLY